MSCWISRLYNIIQYTGAAPFRKARITSDLGTYPYDFDGFVCAYMTSRGYRQHIDGTYSDANNEPLQCSYIHNEMVIWTAEHREYSVERALSAAWST